MCPPLPSITKQSARRRGRSNVRRRQLPGLSRLPTSGQPDAPHSRDIVRPNSPQIRVPVAPRLCAPSSRRSSSSRPTSLSWAGVPARVMRQLRPASNVVGSCWCGTCTGTAKPERKEKPMTERHSTHGAAELGRGVLHELSARVGQQRRPGAGLDPGGVQEDRRQVRLPALPPRERLVPALHPQPRQPHPLRRAVPAGPRARGHPPDEAPRRDARAARRRLHAGARAGRHLPDDAS